MPAVLSAHSRPARLPHHIDETSGAGSFAVVAPCDGYVKVSRHADRSQAERTLARLETGCGHACWPSQHRLVGPLAE